MTGKGNTHTDAHIIVCVLRSVEKKCKYKTFDLRAKREKKKNTYISKMQNHINSILLVDVSINNLTPNKYFQSY